MLDLAFIRSHPDKVKKAAEGKRQPVDVDHILTVDEERRGVIARVEELRSLRNKAGKDIAEAKKSGKDASDAIAEMKKVSDEISTLDEKLRAQENELRDLCLNVPNIYSEDTPEGRDENDNVVVSEWGETTEYTFTPKPHWDLARELDIVDFERATKVAGSNFALFKGAGATLERALFNFMMDAQADRGYTEMLPPYLVNRDAMTGTGQLPKFEEDMYRCEEDDLFIIPTAEVPVTNVHRDEILEAGSLPIKYVAYSACFRREAGSYGRDTRGLTRVHQFDKVELVKFVEPGTSYDELETLLADAEFILQQLGLKYRVLKLCSGELSFASSKTYDIEAWAPGIERWMEVSSCSNFEEFQARRCNIRYRDKDGKPQLVHTLNGSGVALARTILAIIETFQREDGTIEIPEVLRPYMKGRKVIG